MIPEKCYILIDDDPVSNLICSMVIKTTVENAEINIFQSSEEALAFFQEDFIKQIRPAIIFLDINMPPKTGWDFLDDYERFSENMKSMVSIYMLSSSIDPVDMDKADSYESVKGFLSKPMEKTKLLALEI